jgi:7-dehydrocholesterol reductase
MICWGCLVWLPTIYTSHSFYLATHPIDLGLPLASLIFIAGVVCIYINFDSDR